LGDWLKTVAGWERLGLPPDIPTEARPAPVEDPALRAAVQALGGKALGVRC
jgi:hypothetical protein